MSDQTKIEWTDTTWNPIAGCSKVSAGCENCYAIRVAERLARFPQTAERYAGLTRRPSPTAAPNWTGVVRLNQEALSAPFRWRKPRRVFVNSMSDLFHPDVSPEWLLRIWLVMAATPHHTYQILTKRPSRMAEILSDQTFRDEYETRMDAFLSAPFLHDRATPDWPLPNVWLGTSVEHQPAADERIPHLIRTPATLRFLSCEPLLGPVDLAPYLIGWHSEPAHHPYCDGSCKNCPVSVQVRDRAQLDWIIVGGENGTGARPCHPQWVRDIRDQCVAASVPFFFKQWGAWAPRSQIQKMDACTKEWGSLSLDGSYAPLTTPWNGRDDVLAPDGLHEAAVRRVGKKAAGALLDGREWREMPNG